MSAVILPALLFYDDILIYSHWHAHYSADLILSSFLDTLVAADVNDETSQPYENGLDGMSHIHSEEM